MRKIIGLMLSVALLAACGRTPIYRASAKLFVSTTGGVPTGDLVTANDATFYNTACEIMRSQTMLRRVQQRLHKTPVEMRENLANLKIVRSAGADLMLITVDSPAQDFARDFANAVCDEYLKFREEERAQRQDSALLGLTREIQRLFQEIRAVNERIMVFEKEHGLPANADVPELRLLREDSERIRQLYNILLGQLLKIDVLDRTSRNVSVLEYASGDLRPVNRWFFQRD